jgi:hypothetical protein
MRPKPLVLHRYLLLRHCIGRFLVCFNDTREFSPVKDELPKPRCMIVVHFDSDSRTRNNHLCGLLITHKIILDLVQSSKLYVELEMPVIGSPALMSKQVSLRAITQQCLWFEGMACINPASISKNHHFIFLTRVGQWNISFGVAFKLGVLGAMSSSSCTCFVE